MRESRRKEEPLETTIQRIRRITSTELDLTQDEITPDSSFVDDLGADSLDVVELVMAFEEEFDIEIPDSDAEKLVTVKDVVEYIDGRIL